MTTALKALMDDVAADAVEDLRIDVDAVVARSRRRRVRLRSTGSALMMAAAAALAAAFTLPAVLTPPIQPAQEPAGPVGMPDRWYFAPAFAPPVTRAPMSAASMILAGDGRSPVLVSSDAQRYARLPWGDHDALATLSDDGTMVAWAEQSSPASVHVLRLADGHREQADLPAGWGRAAQLVWSGDQVYVVGQDRVARVDGDSGRSVEVCRCGTPWLAVDAQGDLVQGAGGALPGVREVVGSAETSRESTGWRDPVSRSVAVSPTGDRLATARLQGTTGWALQVSGGGVPDIAQTFESGQVAAVQPLTWTDAGVVVRIEVLEKGNRRVSLQLVDPDEDRSGLLSVRMQGSTVPLAVAPGLVGDGVTIEAAEPEFPAWDRERLLYAAGALWDRYWPAAPVALGAAVLLLTGLLVRRRRSAPA